MKFIYPAIITKTETGCYHASFPDLACCEAEGETLDEVLDNANAAVVNWIEVELETECMLPPVSDPEDIPLKENEFVRNICVTIRMSDGWEE